MDSSLTNGSFNFFSGLTTIEIPERQVSFANVERLKIGLKLKVDKNMTFHIVYAWKAGHVHNTMS